MEDMRRQEVRELARLTAPLTAAQQAFFQGEYGRHRRNPTTALLLCLLLGGFGAHYFYFGRHRAGLLRLLLCWTLVPAVLALFDARTIGARAIRYNASLANELLLALRDTVHEQPREVDALEALSTPMALAPTARAALYAGDEPDAAADSAEAALIAAAYAGRESTQVAPTDDAANGHAAAAYAPPMALGGDGAADALNGVLAEPRLPASEYDTWYDAALHEAPAAATNGQDSVIGPDAPQWVPLPEWPAPASRPQPAAAADDWAMPNLGQPDGSLASAHPQIAAADLLDGTGFSVRHERAADLADRPNPGIAAAAGAAAAAWAGQELSRQAQASETPLPPEREPVFMYQAAPAVRRPAVHYGPATSGADSDAWAAPGAPALPRGLGEDVGLASLGSLLAAGLADLLRERPEPLRTRPLTQPPAASDAAVAAPGYGGLHAISAPASSSESDLEDPWAVSDSIRAPLAVSPHLMPEPDELALGPDEATTIAPHADWLTYGAGGTALAGAGMWALDGAHDVASDAPEPSADPFALAEPVAAAVPGVEPAPLPAAYASVPSQGLRRRITHRLFVRKMAVLEGRVVAESSVERQVELVDDDALMDQRVREATQSASREALENLLQLAPPEALPAIRAQLRSLDLAAS